MANLLTAALAAVIGYAVLSPQIKLILYIFALCGVLISAANLLPMKISGIAQRRIQSSALSKESGERVGFLSTDEDQ